MSHFIRKPNKQDLTAIEFILRQWTDEGRVKKYIDKVIKVISEQRDETAQFFVATSNEKIVGVAGIDKPSPEILKYSRTNKPVELKIIFIDQANVKQGVGGTLLDFIEKEAQSIGYKEIILGSAEKYRRTAYKFYLKMKYSELGIITIAEEQVQVFSKKI